MRPSRPDGDGSDKRSYQIPADKADDRLIDNTNLLSCAIFADAGARRGGLQIVFSMALI